MAQLPKNHFRGRREAPTTHSETWTSRRYLESVSDLGLSAEQAGFKLAQCSSLRDRTQYPSRGLSGLRQDSSKRGLAQLMKCKNRLFVHRAPCRWQYVRKASLDGPSSAAFSSFSWQPEPIFC